ncbi:MAG TPA: DUF4255 domain-containing protein [Lacunisphaera sp.]|nr:DUF4255 domain-containing protein [Lacunisphaera sp.]
MALPSAIATVSHAVVGLLEDARPNSVSFQDVRCRLYAPAELQAPREALGEVVSVCAYRVAFNTSRRNQPPRTDPVSGRRFRPSVPVDVYLLVTAWAKDPEKQLQFLGWAIRTLENCPTLPAGFLNRFAGNGPAVFNPGEAVDLVAEAVTQQDLYTIWQVAPTRQQPSVVYVARMILLDSPVELDSAGVVQTRVFDQREILIP